MLLTLTSSIAEDIDKMWGGRHLTSEDDDAMCEDYDGVDPWMAILYLIFTVYLFIALAIVCDEWFVPSLEKISEVLKLSSDVAGATFMAAGSSAPELFVSVADTFGRSHGSGYGVGTIVGSAMFNILVIVAMSAACCSSEIVIDWKPVFRDCLFYCLAIIVMVIVISDMKMEWYEGLIMVIIYAGYILFMVFNQRIFTKMEMVKEMIYGIPPPISVNDGNESDDSTTPTVEMNPVIASQIENGSETGSAIIKNAESTPNKEDDEDEADPDNYWHRFEWPEEGKLDQAWYVLTIPLIVAFTFTIPDCTKTKCEKFYALTFIMSILWIMILCMLMVECAAAVGCLLNISPVIMGIVVLSVGTSVPDALGSVSVAKNGEADMAIANAVGSNVFDILLGLGIPWMLYAAIHEKPLTISDKCGIGVPIAILFFTLAFYVTVLFLNKWKMNSKLGIIFLSFYFVYLLYTILVGFDVIDISGKECD